MKTNTQKHSSNKNETLGGYGYTMGIAIGLGLGVALDNVAIGLAIGVALAISFGQVDFSKKNKK